MRLVALRWMVLTALLGSSACSALLDTDALKTEPAGDGGARDRGLADGRARDRGVVADRGIRPDAAVPTVALTLAAASGAVLTQMNVTGPAQTGAAIVFTLRNTGTAATAGVPLPTLSNLANFAVITNACGAALAANASCTFSVGPKATTNGPYNATLRVTSGSASSNTLTLEGTASGFTVPPVLSLSAASGAVLDAMNVTAPGPNGAPITFTVRNTGSTAMAAAVVITLASPTHFLVETNTCTAALAANATCTFVVRPTATANGSYESSLQVAVGETASNPLTLSGTASGFAPAVTLTPSADQTGMNVTPGANPGAAVTFTVRNTGSAPTTVAPTVVLSSTTNFEVSVSTCTAVLAAAATCTFGVRPKATADGALSGTVQVTAGTDVSSGTVNLSGTASGFGPAVRLTPASAQTGMDVTLAANPGAAVTFTVENTGTAPTTAAPNVVLSNTTNFEVSADTCTVVLAAQATCTFDVKPKATVDGAFSGTVLVNAGTGVSSAPVSLSGTATGL
ncbi:MAG: choice-of-anchor D domain-containing protein [Proteobacteria bacterium]|nr:choice-of-anchor D domain-containing protein [Pseudomonadota bacterium]